MDMMNRKLAGSAVLWGALIWATGGAGGGEAPATPVKPEGVETLREAARKLGLRAQALADRKHPLYLRNRAHLEVRQWAIREGLSWKLDPAKHAEPIRMISRMIAETNMILEHAEKGRDLFAEARGGASFIRGVYVKGGKDPIPYAIRVPSTYDGERSWPLFIYFHGGGGRVNLASMALRRRPIPLGSAGAATASRDDISGRSKRPLPAGVYAADHYIKIWPFNFRRTWIAPDVDDYVFACIEDVKKAYNVNVDRFYTQGFSAGGHGVWGLTARYPDRFAGAGPSGANSATARLRAENFLNVPVYICHGLRDDTQLASMFSRPMFEKLKAWGYDAVYAEDVRLAHSTPADLRAGQEFWLLSRRRNRWPKRVIFVTDNIRYHKAY